MYRMGFYALIPVRRELRDLRICRFQYERYTVIYPPPPPSSLYNKHEKVTIGWHSKFFNSE